MQAFARAVRRVGLLGGRSAKRSAKSLGASANSISRRLVTALEYSSILGRNPYGEAAYPVNSDQHDYRCESGETASRPTFMNPRAWLLLAASVLLPAAAAHGATRKSNNADPLHFFEGRTEMVSTTKIITQKPFLTRTVGHGKIADDGVLELIQHVEEQGRRKFDRSWHIRQIGPGRFGGTMSEAATLVSIERVGERYLFRFKLKDGLSVEEWLVPQNDNLVRVLVTIRKYGIAVVHSDGWIRKLG